MTPLKITKGLRHVALQVILLEATVAFYQNILGMRIEWQPDADNVYLTSGTDNLALHRSHTTFSERKEQRLDHIGFLLDTHEEVDAWYEYFVEKNIAILLKPKTHRDGARSFYAADPDGNVVQMICLTPVSDS